MNDLVQRLCEGQHPVEVTVWPEKTVSGLKEALDRRYVHVRFTATRGGTELGVPLDDRTDLGGGDFDNARGHITLSGRLTLDYEPVRCVAVIDLSTLSGTGHLERDTAASPREQ